MRKLILLQLCLLVAAFRADGQIFWVENFESGSSAGLSVSSYSGWSNTVLSSEGTYYNEWYVSCAEQGHTAGVCGDVCGTSTGLGSSLHLGANASLGGDAGATYDNGGLCSAGFCVSTDRRAESPTINCTGKTGITISFYYIEGGDTTTDNATLWYYDGSTWSPLADPYKTPVCSSGQGSWMHFSTTLPASANNNANVKIGFRWVNNDDGSGNDPSFAVDSISLSTAGSSTGTVPTPSFTVNDTVVCQDSCITLYNTTTGAVDSIRWAVSGTGVTIGNVHGDTTTACFSGAGYFTVHLYDYSGGHADSVTHLVHIMPAPHPTVNQSLRVLSVTGAYTGYQWYKNGTIISGATNSSYTYTISATYQVLVDSAGCQGMSVAKSYTTGIAEVSATGTNFVLISRPGSETFELAASIALDEAVQVMVYDATGRVVLRDEWEQGSIRKQFSVSGASSGLYIVRIGNAGTSAVLKWLRQ